MSSSIVSETPIGVTTSGSKRDILAALNAATRTFWQKWYGAFKQIFSVYMAVHLAFFVTTCFSFLFILNDFQETGAPLSSLWHTWRRWDTAYYLDISQGGYSTNYRTAFFPFYSIIIHVVTWITHNPLISALMISDLAGLVLLVVLYQMVKEDFDQERAYRTVLYLSIFPTAFFFAAGYNESLFVCLSLLSFYNMRHGQWWWAGLFGLLASLTRSTGLLLALPFCYEYLSQRQFRLRAIRLDVVSMALVPVGTGLFAIYCYYRFGDPLAFSHAQAHWNHELHGPWHGIIGSINAIRKGYGLLSFQTLRNLTDLVPDLMVLVLLALSLIGPWRFPRSLWSYCVYGIALYLFLQSFPVAGTGLFPLQSLSRYLLEVFPAFIVLAAFGKSRAFNLNYLMISGALLFFLLTQFLTGHWVL